MHTLAGILMLIVSCNLHVLWLLWHSWLGPTGSPGLLQCPPVASAPLLHCLPAHGGFGAQEVWGAGLECSLRIQSSRLPGISTVHTKPPWWYGSEKGQLNMLQILIDKFFVGTYDLSLVYSHCTGISLFSILYLCNFSLTCFNIYQI